MAGTFRTLSSRYRGVQLGSAVAGTGVREDGTTADIAFVRNGLGTIPALDTGETGDCPTGAVAVYRFLSWDYFRAFESN